jgi:hypothetical protein
MIPPVYLSTDSLSLSLSVYLCQVCDDISAYCKFVTSPAVSCALLVGDDNQKAQKVGVARKLT